MTEDSIEERLHRLVGPAALRDRTEQGIIDLFFAESGPLTRVDIASRTGLSKPTVNAAVRRLESGGLLAAAGVQTGRQGRVATFYEVASSAGAVVAVALDPNAIRVGVSDLTGRHVTRAETAPPRHPDGVADALRAAVRTATEDAGSPVRAVAVSVAKPVDPRTLTVLELPDTPYPEGLVQPTAILDDLGDVPLLVDNDVNLAALGEQYQGLGHDLSDFAYLYVGAGLGLGLVVGGRLVRGSRGLAGEIGYLPSRADPDGGRHGLGRAVAALGLGPRRRDAWDADTVTEAHALLRAAADGEPRARAAVTAAGRALGEAVTAVCAITDPELVVLGGPVGTHPLLVEQVRATVDALAAAPTPVAAGALGADAPLEGALELARRHARARL